MKGENMITELLGCDTFCSFELGNRELVITLRGDSLNGVIESWYSMKQPFELQLSDILENHEVERIFFRGDHFGQGMFNLCRYELKDFMKEKCCKSFQITEEYTMKMIYIENAIFCDRYSVECENGLNVEIDAPLDSVFHFKREDGVEYVARLQNGAAAVPGEFLQEGKYLVFLSVPHGLPTNILQMAVTSGVKGKYISCSKDYDDLLDAVYKLMRTFCKTEKKVSAHIDGYEVI